jgi:hypothetical protein
MPDETPKKADLEKLARSFAQFREESGPFRATIDEVEKYVMPRLGGEVGQGKKDESQATWKNPDRWDSTAPAALRKLVAHLHSAVAPAGSQWFSGAFPVRELQADKTSREWIEGNAKIYWQELEASDFQTQIGSALVEYAGVGNTFVTQEVLEAKDGRWKGLDYTAVPVRECEFEEDSRGRVRTWFRELSWSPVQMIDRFGVEGVPDVIRKKAESGNEATKRESVVFCVFERPGLLAPMADGKVLAPMLRPYGYVYFLLEGHQLLGEEGGYYEWPAFLARWERTPGSRWAHGLGHLVLPPAKGVNAWLEMLLAAQAKALDPPALATEDGIMADPDFGPQQITQVRSLDDIKILEHQGRFDVGQAALTDQRNEIRRILLEDQLELERSPQMTALEFQLRYDQMLRLLGANTARLGSEFFDQMLEAGYRAMYRAGKFPEAPALVKEKGETFSFVYLGPMARARRTDRVAAAERGASYVAGLRKMGFEEVKHVFKPIQSVRDVFEDLGIPSTQLASDSEVKAAQQREAELQERMLRAEAARAEGEAVEQGASAVSAAAQVSTTEPLPAQPPPILTPPL